MDERILGLLKEARRQLELERQRRSEPIAIVGIGCRFPGGVSSPEQFWRLLEEGRDATREVPTDRWDADALYDPDPDAPGKSYVKRGGFLERIDGFDPEFFGISPREAHGMDPQQRLLLEVVWEALEDAGLPPEALRGTSTGVWIGLCLDDYARRSVTSGDLARIDPYTALGNTRSVAAGRIAYVLDLRGPAIQLDTACSSSLVAVHQACQSLRAGESKIALVGGVNLMSSPEATIALCKLRALSPEGLCKAFDASANGYARGEGCGIIVLKRLSDALADDDRIHAVIRGTAVNHDGRSNGLTAPNGIAQEAVIRAALHNGDVEPSRIGYVEAHGTGTPLGDPIELLALSRVYGQGREQERPLYVGTVKTNFGHLEGAAGIAGLIKVALGLTHGAIPASLHFAQPNPRIPWDSVPVRVAASHTRWPSGADGMRFAGLSSFGISGTNAHLVLSQAPQPERTAAPARSAELVVLTGKTPEAALAAAARLREHLASHPEPTLGELAYTSVAGRSSFEYRVALPATDRRSLEEMLKAGGDVAVTRAHATSTGVVFVFPGQGSQWLGMGRQLLAEEHVFRASLEATDRVVARETGWSVLEELGAASQASRLERLDVVQPVLFALQVALAALWRAWGVEPQAVIGHSLGEVAAAQVAGALSLEDAAAIVCRRSRLLRRISGQGEMALVELSVAEAQAALADFEDRVGLGVINGSRSVVLSGEPGALARVLERLELRGVFCRRVKVDVASHSPQVEPLLSDLRVELAGVSPRVAEIPMISTVTGKAVTGTELTAEYWSRNLRDPVRFAPVVQSLLAAHGPLFLEVSPHPLLVSAVNQLAQESGSATLATGSLRREQPERLTLLQSLGALFAHGLELDATRLFPSKMRRVELPTYAWQRRRFWADAVPLHAERRQARALLGPALDTSGGELSYESTLSLERHPWIAEHRVARRIVVPGSALAELAWQAAHERRQASCALVDVVLQAPLLLAPEQATRIKVASVNDSTLAISSRRGAEEAWQLHATAQVAPRPTATPAVLELAAIRSRCVWRCDVEETYAVFRKVGIEYGESFRNLRALWRGTLEAFAEIQLGSPVDAGGYGVHPALLDAAFQAVAGALGAEQSTPRPLLPASIGRLVVHAPGVSRALVHVRLRGAPTSEGAVLDLTLCDDAGVPLIEVNELVLRAVDLASLDDVGTDASASTFFRLGWAATPTPSSATLSGRWLIVSIDDDARARALCSDLSRRGARAEYCTSAQRLDFANVDHVVCLWSSEGGAREAMAHAQVGLGLVRSVLEQASHARLWWVTQQAVAVGGEAVHPAAAALWGLARTAMLEVPELRCTLLDVEAEAPIGELVARELEQPPGEQQVAWRVGARYVARLERAEPSTPSEDPKQAMPCRGTVLITGGLGAIGGAAARVLARRGTPHLLLLGRRGADTPGADELCAELRALGARVTIVAADVADREALAGAIASLTPEHPLCGVIHAAGVLEDGLLSSQAARRFGHVMEAKVLGAWHLHELTHGTKLDFFVMCSSLAGILGSPGQGAYAAANAFLDALAASRRARGLAAQSLAWGPWSEQGLAASLSLEHQQRLARLGIGMTAPEQGEALFERALERPETTLIIVPLDLQRATRALGPESAPLWSHLLRSAATPAAGDDNPAVDLHDLAGDEQAALVTRIVQTEVARVLSLPSPGSVPLEGPLKDLGLDSLMMLELRRSLAKRTGVTLPTSLALEKPTARRLVQHLLAELSGSASRRPVATDLGQRSTASDGDHPARGEVLAPLGSPRLRLICFHHAGGNADVFATFGGLATRGIELHTISTSRRSPTTRASASAYLATAADYVQGLSDTPVALLGHSLGSLFAWRVAHELGERTGPSPLMLVVSAPPIDPTLRSQPLDGAMPHSSGLEADTFLWSFMPPAPAAPLAMPIAAFLGKDDPIVKADSLERWRSCTTRTFTLELLPGNHFYLFQRGSPFLQRLLERIETELEPSLTAAD